MTDSSQYGSAESFSLNTYRLAAAAMIALAATHRAQKDEPVSTDVAPEGTQEPAGDN